MKRLHGLGITRNKTPKMVWHSGRIGLRSPEIQNPPPPKSASSIVARGHSRKSPSLTQDLVALV